MGRLFIVAIAVLAVVFGGRWLISLFESDEDKIRGLIERAAGGFNDSRMQPCMEAFASEYVDESSGFGKEDLRGVLASAFFQQVDPNTKAFLLRVEAMEVEVVVGEEGEADSTFVLELYEGLEGDRELKWSSRVSGSLRELESGWRFVDSSHETIEGTTP